MKSFFNLDDGSPLNPQADGELPKADLSAYRAGLRLVHESATRKFTRLGNRGLNHLFRALLTIFSNEDHDTSFHNPIQQAVKDVHRILESTFCETTTGLRAIPANPLNLYPVASSTDLMFVPVVDDALHYLQAGTLYWHQCLLRTGSSKLQYDGPNLFENPVISSAFSFAISGDFRIARQVLEKALPFVARSDRGYDAREVWLALAATHFEEGNYNRAIEIFEQALMTSPAWFRHDNEFWERWYLMYDITDNLEGAIQRFSLALKRQEGDCWIQLSRAYVEGARDYASAIAVLGSASEVSSRELTAEEWYDIGDIYDVVLNHLELAAKAYEKAIVIDRNDRSFSWPEAVKIYGENVKRHGDEQLAILNAVRHEAPISSTFRQNLWSRFVDLCRRRGQIDLAIFELENRLKNNPKEKIFWNLLLTAYSFKGNRDMAVEIFRTAVNEDILGARDFGLRAEDHSDSEIRGISTLEKQD